MLRIHLYLQLIHRGKDFDSRGGGRGGAGLTSYVPHNLGCLKHAVCFIHRGLLPDRNSRAPARDGVVNRAFKLCTRFQERTSIDRGGTHKFAYICIYIPLHRPIAAATAYLPPRDPSPSDSPGRPWAPSLDREYVPRPSY